MFFRLVIGFARLIASQLHSFVIYCVVWYSFYDVALLLLVGYYTVGGVFQVRCYSSQVA